MIQRAPAALMAAASLMMRILLVCWLSDLLFSSTISAELPGGGWDLRRLDYGNRRPLHYVRTLRQPIIRTAQASGDQGITQHGNIIQRQKKPQKQTLSLPQVFSSQPTQQRNSPPARPRGFQLNLDIPLLELDQNQMPHTKGSHESPAAVVNLRSSPQSSSFSVPEKSAEDPHRWTSDHVPISPSPAAKTPSLSPSDYLRLARLIKEGTNVQSRYIEPAQQLLDLVQAESRPPLNYADAVRKQLTQIGSKWPILSSDSGKKQNEEVAKESEGWHPAQHGSPALPPAEQSWDHQKLDVGKPSQHPEKVDWYSNAHTSMAQDKDHTILSNPNLPSSSILQREITDKYYKLPRERQYGNSDQSNIEIKGTVKLRDPDFSQGSQKTAEPGREPSSPRLHLSLSLPIKAKTPNVEVQRTSNRHVKTAQMSTQPGSTWQSSSSDYTKPAPQTETKWPILSVDTGHQNYPQQPQDYIQTKPAVKLPFSAHYSNRQTSPPWPNQDETFPGPSPAFHKPATAKPSPVSYSPTHSRHDSYINYPHPRNDLNHATGLTPSLSQMTPSLYHSSSGKFSEPPRGIQLSSAPESDRYGRFKPSTERARTPERMHLGSTYDLTTLKPPNWYAAAATSSYETRRPHHQQKHVFPEESSQQRHRFPTGYETQKKLPEWKAGQDGRDKSAKIYINIEHGAVDSDGQSDTKTDGYQRKWHGDEGPQSQTANPSTINLQALMSLDKGALADLLKSHQSKKPSYAQSGCMGRAGDCSHHFPRPDSYSPYAEATSVTDPSNAQQFFESRSYHF
ncbi:uncharacterized protein LOC112141164 [Oryzias melastigma]|uniref:uncharacterized protein LOC112141164 n=1 Tax=Oryzias melastigma TaxID=30732 RepID=UPI000CF82F87|nr:uncharacterized protein LOC112141164 [Oryzias melastigma]